MQNYTMESKQLTYRKSMSGQKNEKKKYSV